MADKTVTYRLAADITAFRAQLAQAAASVRHTADEMTAATKRGDTFRSGLNTLGSTAGKVGLVAAAGLGAAILSAAKFDEAMAHVAAATHESSENMGRLRDAALEAGARTVFSATEAANAIEELSKAGVSTADILGGGLNSSLDLAAAGTIDVAQAAEIAATTMNQFGIAGDDAGRVADVLAAAAGKAQGEVTDIAEALKYVGPVAHQMGVSLEEAGGSIAYLATQGIQGEQAGTGLRGMLLSLTSPSKMAKDELEKLGISLYDAQGNFVGLDGVAGQLHSTMEGLTNAERDEALGRIFGNAQVTTARILYAGGASAIHKWTSAVDDSGYAAETAATKMDSLKGDLEKLGGALQTALIGAGSGSQGPLRSMVQGLTNVVDAFNDLPDAAKSATTSLLSITAVTGGGLWFTSKVVQGVADTRKALADLGLQAGTTQRLMAGLGKGIEFTAIIVGLQAVDEAFDKLGHNDLEGSELNRSLEALARGEISGTIADVFGQDLGRIGTDFDTLSNKVNQAQNLFEFLVPGDGVIEEAERRLGMLDAALAGLVESGHSRMAARAFEQITAAAEESGATATEVKDRFEQYGLALDNAGKGTNFFAESMGKALSIFGPVASGATRGAGGLKALGDAAGEGADKVNEMVAALETLAGFLDRRAAVRNYEQALDDLGTSIKENGKSFDVTTQKGRNNQQALDDVASAAGQVASHMKGLNRQEFMARAAADIRARAKELGLPAAAIQVIINKLIEASRTKAEPKVEPQGIPETHRDLDGVKRGMSEVDRARANPVVDVNGSPAFAAIEGIKTALRNIPDEQVLVHVNRVGGVTSSYGGSSAPDTHVADGGTIGGARYPYGDKILAHLAPGEEVISNRYGQADRHRDLLKAINANAYENGGTVQRMAMAPRSPSVHVTASSGPVTAVARLHPEDVAAIATAVRAGSFEGTAKGMDDKARAMQRQRRAGI